MKTEDKDKLEQYFREDPYWIEKARVMYVEKVFEGAMKLVPFKGRVKFVLRKVKEQIQSACSWSGAHSLHSFQKKVIWRRIGDGARKESKI